MRKNLLITLFLLMCLLVCPVLSACSLFGNDEPSHSSRKNRDKDEDEDEEEEANEGRPQGQTVYDEPIGPELSHNGRRDDTEDTTVPVVKDNDKTGYTPENWSWKAKGEGYGKKYYTSGKYVRKDGNAVIYLDSSDTPDGFSYQLFALADGAKTSNLYIPSQDSEESYSWGEKEDDKKAIDYGYGIFFACDGKGKLTLENNWDEDELRRYAL